MFGALRVELQLCHFVGVVELPDVMFRVARIFFLVQDVVDKWTFVKLILAIRVCVDSDRRSVRPCGMKIDTTQLVWFSL